MKSFNTIYKISEQMGFYVKVYESMSVLTPTGFPWFVSLANIMTAPLQWRSSWP